MGKRLRDEDDAPTPSQEDVLQTASSPAKIIELEEEHVHADSYRMQCSLPPHDLLSFASTREFDVHYAKEHTNRCSSCGKNFPSAHYLTLHIDEHHNPVREELAAQGEKTYSCFLEDCDKVCSTPQKRRLHLIDKHMFPRIYDFRIIDHGIDKSTSLLQGGQRRRLSTTTSIGRQRRASSIQKTGMEQEATTSSAHPDGAGVVETTRYPPQKNEPGVAGGIDELESSFAALKFVPSSVQARQRNKKSAS
ncbi:hypothetical protein LTR64_005270 [Lithohypha guttulata]|uniref:C2H2-type domain-containing protein n=1 Tax=Lithohypha guttulata TaxID=1690604 RepID=A0AAN7Y4W2_9EURO|nr:hypothetical protein LTR51_002938 [Lithohypha guttulata]KAK5083122.1 hypothetical protein LTR05_007005 [Lithohypha guttulata]